MSPTIDNEKLRTRETCRLSQVHNPVGCESNWDEETDEKQDLPGRFSQISLRYPSDYEEIQGSLKVRPL